MSAARRKSAGPLPFAVNGCSWPIVLIHLLMPYVHPASYFSDKRAGVGVEGVPDGDLARGGLKKAARAAVLAAY